MSISRRRFLTRSGLAAAGGAAAAPHLSRAADARARAGQKPARIIQLVADGMSMGTLTCADHLSQLLRGRGLAWMQLYNQPGVVSAMMNVRSLNSLVTDSSASACAWGSGSRIVNGTVNILPDGRVLKTLYELFGEAGWKRGLVTTTEITHATPAGFAASGLKREAAETIAVQYLERGIEVLLGGGRKFFDPKQRKDKRDLKPDYVARGYTVMETAAQLKAAPLDKPWLGTFDASHLPFTLDQLSDAQAQANVPTLAEMTRRALAKLARETNFILQVEGGRVDHACHVCDAAGALHDQIAFDEALEVCLEFQKQNPDTLVVLTTDHGNGNLGLNGTGPLYGFSSPLFANLKQVKASFTQIMKRLRLPTPLEQIAPAAPAAPGTTPAPIPPPPKYDPLVDVKEIQRLIRETTGYDLTEQRARLLVPFLERKGVTMYGIMNSVSVQLGQMMGNHIGIGWSSNAHTADYVPLLALGPGAERFRGFIQNTDVFKHYTALANIDFKNPEVPLLAGAGAREELLQPGEEVHWA